MKRFKIILIDILACVGLGLLMVEIILGFAGFQK